jgi:phosphonate transport system ATP-binding protein
VLLKKLYGDDARELLDDPVHHAENTATVHHTAASAPVLGEITPAATHYPFALKPAPSN